MSPILGVLVESGFRVNKRGGERENGGGGERERGREGERGRGREGERERWREGERERRWTEHTSAPQTRRPNAYTVVTLRNNI